MKFLTTICVGVILPFVLVIPSQTARAQVVAPVGSDDVSVGPGAGLSSPVTPAGGYSAEVPLSLPPPRGKFSIPLSVSYSGTTAAGAAGSGWELPLSTVYVSASTWHRKPAAGSDAPVVRERVTLTLGGASVLMVPGNDDDLFVPFLSDQYLELRRHGTGWTLDTPDGAVYDCAARQQCERLRG